MGCYLVIPPEPVGEISTLIDRIGRSIPENGTALFGFDFPIGLPRKYAEKVGLTNWRQAIGIFGTPGWERFYGISDRASLHQPFFPLPRKKGEKGDYRAQLAHALCFENLDELLRRCDKKTDTRPNAECLFFTLGPKQVGASVIVGWRDVLAPAVEAIRFWPFDGDLDTLVQQPGIVVAEIYPREAYTHLGIAIGAGIGRSKTKREDRRKACEHLLETVTSDYIKFSEAAKSSIFWGFERDDDFDAMVGLLSMLLVVTGQRDCGLPSDDLAVHSIEGWILGQSAGR